MTVSSRNGTVEGSFPEGIITSGRNLGDRKSASVDTWAWLAVRLLLQPLNLLQVICPVRGYSLHIFRYVYIFLKLRMERRFFQIRELDAPQQLQSVVAVQPVERNQFGRRF